MGSKLPCARIPHPDRGTQHLHPKRCAKQLAPQAAESGASSSHQCVPNLCWATSALPARAIKPFLSISFLHNTCSENSTFRTGLFPGLARMKEGKTFPSTMIQKHGFLWDFEAIWPVIVYEGIAWGDAKEAAIHCTSILLFHLYTSASRCIKPIFKSDSHFGQI